MTKTGLRYFVAFLLLISSGYTALYAQVPGRVDTLINRVEGFNALVNGGIMQSDCTIIAYGNFTKVRERLINRIAKLNPDGTNDYTFNPGTGANGLVNAVRVQPDGNLLVGGAMTQYNGVTSNRLFRIAQNGTKDATFTANLNSTVYDFELLSSGKIVAVGAFTSVNSTTTNRIVRLNTDGTKDGTFTIGTGFNNIVYSVAVQPDGKYIVSGDFTSYNGTTVNRLARINTDGSLDNTFNNGGSGPNGYAADISVLPNGKILIGGGFTTFNSITVNRFACLDTTGTRDSTFNMGSGFNNPVLKIFPDVNGKVVIGGVFSTYKGVSYNRIIRVDTTGTPDSTFVIGTGFSYNVNSIFQGPGTDIYVAGENMLYNGYSRLGITRLKNNGSIDNNIFNKGGFNGDVLDVAVQSDGKTILVGYFTKYHDDTYNYIARFNLDGTIDNTFNSGGAGPNGTLLSVGVQSDDKIIIGGGGMSTFNGNASLRIARLNSNGSYDNTFQKGTGFNCCGINTIVVLPDDKIFIGSNSSHYNGISSPKLIKLNSDGTKDNSFSVGTGFVNGNSGVTGVHVQQDGKIIVAGDYNIFQSQTRVGIIRLNSNGTLDPTFDAKSSTGLRAELQPDGKILVGMFNMSFDGVVRQRVARLNSDGSLDMNYNASNTANAGGGGSWPNDIQFLGRSSLYGGTMGTTANPRLIHFDDAGVFNAEFYQGGAGNTFGIGGYLQRIVKDDKFGRIIIAGQFARIQDHYTSNYGALQNYIDSVIVDSMLCANEVTKVYFQKRISFNSSNIFTAELSNASGSFTSPITVGIDTTDGWGADSIQVIIPSGTAYGTGYKIRIVSTDPVFTSWASNAFTINVMPLQKVVLQTATEVYPSLTAEVKVTASQTGVHYSLMNDTTVVDTGSGNGDTLRLYTNGIYSTTDYTIIAQANGCSRILDTVIVDTLALIPVSWQLEGINEYPDHSLHAIPGNGKPEAKGYNLMKAGQNGAMLYRFQTGDNYEGMFGLTNPEGDGEYFFMNILTVDTGKWDSTGLYFSVNKDDVIYLGPAITSTVDVLLKKTGTTLGVYINGLLDTTIVWPDTADFSPIVAMENSSMKGVYSSYDAILHGTFSAQNINCGDKGNATASVSGGSPPYHFHWSNGDTTSAPDSLLVGKYIVTVTDFANDTLVDSVEIAYNALWDTLGNVEPDTLGRLVSVNNTGPFSSYTWAVNSLAESEEGWVQFEVEAGTIFQGSLGTGSNKLIDETTRGVSILVLGNDVYCTGSQFEDMLYLGWYEPGEGYKFRIRFDDDNVYFSKLEEHGGGMDISAPFIRGYDFRPGVVPFENGNVIPEVSTSFGCDAMFTNVSVLPAETMNDQATIRVDVKGGKSPYTYLWSNSATTSTLNVSPGIYTVTITDQNSTTITAQVFAGTYVEWLAANNVEETDDHEIICTETIPVGYSMRYNYIFGKSALKADQDGTVSFDFEKAKDFCGGIGLITDNLASDGSQGFGVFVIQDRLEIGLDKDVYFIDDEGDMQYLGSFENNVAMNIKVRKQGNTLEVIKNDFGGISREYDEPYIFHPFASPIFQNDKITRVTADFGSPLQLISNIQHPACNSNTLGSIDLTAIGGEPPYHYLWSNGDTIADPDSLGIGLYAVTAWDSQNDTIIDSLYVGYAVVWDTLINVDDSLGMLKSNGNNSTVSFNSYAYGLNSLAPEEDGWIEFVLPEKTMFNGAVGMVGNKHYDETSEGIAFNIVDDIMAVSGNMLENSELFGEYKTAAGYKLRIDIAGDNITLTKGDVFGFGPGKKKYYTYHRTEHWSPSVIFGLNGAQVASVSSSFGCGRMHVETRTEPASKDGSVGSIYTDVKGGVAPYIYTWSNSATTANILNVPLGNYTVTVEDQLGDEQVINTFLGRYVDWDVLSGMAEMGTEVIYEGDTVDFDSTIVNFAFGRNAIKPGETGTVSFDFERAADFTGAVGFAESADLSISQDGALAIIGLIEGENVYVLDESGNPAYFGKLRENLPVNIRFKKTPTEFEVTKNGISSIFINTPTTGFLSPIVAPGFPGDKVHRVTCDFGKRLKIVPDVTPIECGTTNTGSITAIVSGGVPPYIYYWNTGDTTDTNDSLIVGDYSVLVIDSIGDSTVAYITMGYKASWHSLVGITANLDNSLSPTLPFDEGNAYAVGASTLYPIVGETGWMEFEVKAGVPFEGYFGLVNQMSFDENMVGVGILVSEGHIYSSSTDPESSNMYLGRYNRSVDNSIRITKLSDDEIEVKVNDVIVLSSEYTYPNTFKPVAYLNSERSTVTRLVSSFCNTYQTELLVNTSMLHVSPTHKGAIYLDVHGGTPPYKFVWGDVTALSDTVIDNITDSLLLQYSLIGINTAGLEADVANSLKQMNSNRVGLDAGNYSVTITDAASNEAIHNFKIGEVSKFAYTDNLENIGGTITKTGANEWETNACVSVSFSQADDDSYFNFSIIETGDFDFGYRSITDTLSDDSTANFTQAEYKAEEYYFVKIRTGQLSYISSEGGNVTNASSINEGDKVSMYLVGNIVYVKVNDVTVVTATHPTTSPYLLNSMARIYNTGASFKIIDNIIYRNE